jgi:hypothetical protein
MDDIRARVERFCLGLPEAAGEGGQHLRFSVRGRTFAWLQEDHHGDGRLSLALKPAPGARDDLLADPEHWFVPPYLGPRGWIGLYIDTPELDWNTVTEALTTSYRRTAPKTLVKRLD